MKRAVTGLFLIVLIGIVAIDAAAAPIVHTSDFIADGTRTNFVDFEGVPPGGSAPNTYSQDGVNILQVNSQPNDIFSDCGDPCFFTPTGRAWYSNGGDDGYTDITRAGGIDFLSVGLTVGGSKFGLTSLQYELLDGGISVLLGSITLPPTKDGYIGFEGGGFDEIRLRAWFSPYAGAFGDGALNGLPIDNIELTAAAVPEPTTLLLTGTGLFVAAVRRRRQRG